MWCFACFFVCIDTKPTPQYYLLPPPCENTQKKGTPGGGKKNNDDHCRLNQQKQNKENTMYGHQGGGGVRSSPRAPSVCYSGDGYKASLCPVGAGGWTPLGVARGSVLKSPVGPGVGEEAPLRSKDYTGLMDAVKKGSLNDDLEGLKVPKPVGRTKTRLPEHPKPPPTPRTPRQVRCDYYESLHQAISYGRCPGLRLPSPTPEEDAEGSPLMLNRLSSIPSIRHSSRSPDSPMLVGNPPSYASSQRSIGSVPKGYRSASSDTMQPSDEVYRSRTPSVDLLRQQSLNRLL
eukprot:TRINITY_DN302_c0_g4_i1.p1 TRINITY_DN302_c0_g4~~TRINITY_DN302_c0_g4_i1.p1  ORF type:complete len:289 (+),score=15.19 TRINITY_DN302_c0_g4_i1:725-1591(+)